ncbi:MAG: hypothetical protein ACREDP_15425 [Bradyrhizobium sp.]
MLTVLISSLVAGAAVGLFARVLAFVISMVVFCMMITAAVALTHEWSALEMVGIFVAAVTVFQIGYLIGLGGRRLLLRVQGKAPVPAPEESRPRWRMPAWHRDG